MQVFIPFPDIEKCVKCLDNKRLNKQIVESAQILAILEPSLRSFFGWKESTSKAWNNHPIIKMWKGAESGLKKYYNEAKKEWSRRGGKSRLPFFEIETFVLPSWWGKEEVHASHRSNLIRKDKDFYSKFFTEEGNKPYEWEVNNVNVG